MPAGITGCGAGSAVGGRAARGGKFLYCQVGDDGRGQPADSAAEPGGAAAWPVEQGHGLWLAGQLADHVSLSHGADGTTATVRFLLSPG
jgi:hypothetical protein